MEEVMNFHSFKNSLLGCALPRLGQPGRKDSLVSVPLRCCSLNEHGLELYLVSPTLKSKWTSASQI